MRKFITPVAICLLLFSEAAAQRPRQKTPAKGTPAAAKPAASPSAATQPPTTPVPAPKRALVPVSIAVVNGQTITSAQYEPALREQIESVEQKIAETKLDLLELQINTLLLQAEARKRGITTERLYALEVSSKLTQPTPAEIQKFVDENPQYSGGDRAGAASQVAAYLLSEREGKVSDQFVQQLKKVHQVVPGVDISTPNLKDDAVVATVAGQTVTAGAIGERLKPIVYRLRLQAYQTGKTKADQLINDLLLLAEANKRGIGPEQIVRTEITEKARQPTDAEILKFYEENKSKINSNLDSVRAQISSYLQDRDRERLESELSEKLRQGADIRWLITEPVQPVQAISTDDDPSRGGANAPVTIVEFTDFQCPSCAAMHPVLEEIIKSYGNSVRLVVRDFPLSQHENAMKAAQAANAAHAQGKFFEYIALLYSRQKALDTASLKKYASELGLNRQRFDAALESGTYEAEIKHDITDADIYGVGSTPTLFVNGVMLRTLSADGLRQAIDRAAAARKTSAPPK